MCVMCVYAFRNEGVIRLARDKHRMSSSATLFYFSDTESLTESVAHQIAYFS